MVSACWLCYHCKMVTIMFIDNNVKLEARGLDFYRLLQMPAMGSHENEENSFTKEVTIGSSLMV